MERTTTFIISTLSPALALALALAAGCAGPELELDGDETSGVDDGADHPGAVADSELPPAPQSCELAWQASLEPGIPDVIGVGPIAITSRDGGGFLVYGHTLKDFAAYLWIGSYDAAGNLEDVVQTDPGVTANTEIWSVDTDGAGNLVVAASLVEQPGDEPTPVLVRFEPDASETWRRPLPADIEAAFTKIGVAASPSGALAVSATKRMSAERTDVWVARLDPSSGEVMWETTVSGPLEGGWSLDAGGPVAITDDGRMFTLGMIRHDYQTTEATLFAFDGVGPDPLWSAVPITDPGSQQFQWGGALELDAHGTVYASVNVESNAGARSLVTAYADGEPLWSASTDEYDWDEGADFLVRALAPDGAGGVSLVGVHTGPQGGEAPFLVELDASGVQGCMTRWDVTDSYFHGMGVARADDGSLLMAGSSGPSEYLTGSGWLGSYTY